MKSIIDSLNIGIRELMAVFIPGGIMCFFLSLICMDYEESLDWLITIKIEWIYILFLFVFVYFIGYTIYAFSSFLDSWYDIIKRRSLELDTGRNANKKLEYIYKENFEIKWWLLRTIFPNLHDTNNLTVKVVQFKNRDIGKELDGYKHQTLDAYQYAYRRLMVENEIMFAEVESYFSTARFFRSMTLVLFAGTFIWLIFEDDKFYSILIGFASIISFFVFLDRWRKANHVALKNVIILEGRNTKKEQDG